MQFQYFYTRETRYRASLRLIRQNSKLYKFRVNYMIVFTLLSRHSPCSVLVVYLKMYIWIEAVFRSLNYKWTLAMAERHWRMVNCNLDMHLEIDPNIMIKV